MDDLRKEKPHINWALNHSKIFGAGGDLVLDIEAAERDRPSKSLGLLHFGPKHRRWLYTKALFQTDPPARVVEDFLRAAMQP